MADEGKGGVKKIHDVSANNEHQNGAAVQKCHRESKENEIQKLLV